jgi:hypothetical protein
MADSNKSPGCEMHEVLVSHLYSETTPEESSLIQAHLNSCSVCADELAAFERVRGMLQTWQVSELPEVSIVTKQDKGRSTAKLREFFTMTPFWLRAIGGLSIAMLVLAATGTTITAGSSGVSLSFSLLGGRGATPTPQVERSSEEIRAELKAIVNSMIAESERQQGEALKSQLVSLESQLQNSHASDLAKLNMRIQQQRDLIKALERDIDRREGLALTDLLFSEAIGLTDERSMTRAPGSED